MSAVDSLPFPLSFALIRSTTASSRAFVAESTKSFNHLIPTIGVEAATAFFALSPVGVSPSSSAPCMRWVTKAGLNCSRIVAPGKKISKG